ncbi:hypothetical protein LKK83_22755 [Phormidium sp. CCY1219]|nr:hypothetical protein [Phormidium sp. CCY1219]
MLAQMQGVAALAWIRWSDRLLWRFSFGATAKGAIAPLWRYIRFVC